MSIGIGRIRTSRPLQGLLVGAGLGCVSLLAFAQSTIGVLAAVIALAALVVCAGAVYAWFYLLIATTTWTIDGQVLTVRDRIQKMHRDLSLTSIATVTQESILGFGMSDPVIVFRDATGSCVLWTVARRWRQSDLEPLWERLRMRPVGRPEATDYAAFDYALRG